MSWSNLFWFCMVMICQQQVRTDHVTSSSFLNDTVSVNYTRQHDFLFVSGWPQSGTSFTHHILSAATRDISTMKEKCLTLFKKGCREWSFEGQWILKFSATNKQAANLLNSGSICPGTIPTSMKAMTHVVTTWGKFWDHSKKLLVEKSPQALLKIASLRRIFSSARSVKYIVVIKHPVTLNVALPREYDWLTHKESVKSYRAKEATARAQGMTRAPPRTQYSNNKIEIINNARHFVQFMTTNQTQATTSNNNSTRCHMGWLEVMEQLHRDLQSDSRNLEEVRIIRFEDFGRPHLLCRNLFQFVFGQHGIHEARMAKYHVCDRYLAPSMLVQHTHPHRRRQLRLIGSSEKPGVEFSHITFERSTQQRIQQYQKAYTYLPSDVKKQLKVINARLKVFGYSLEKGKEYGYQSEFSVFKPWQLLQ